MKRSLVTVIASLAVAGVLFGAAAGASQIALRNPAEAVASDAAMEHDARLIANAANDVFYLSHHFPKDGAVRGSACTTGLHDRTPCDPANAWSVALERTPVCPMTREPYRFTQVWDGAGFDIVCGTKTVWTQR